MQKYGVILAIAVLSFTMLGSCNLFTGVNLFKSFDKSSRSLHLPAGIGSDTGAVVANVDFADSGR